MHARHRLAALTPALAAATLVIGSCGGDDQGDGSGAIDSASIFTQNCESCHGALGTGGHVGPDLQKSTIAEDVDQVRDRVTNGAGQMPAFKGTLSDEEIDAVATYVAEELAPKQ